MSEHRHSAGSYDPLGIRSLRWSWIVPAAAMVCVSVLLFNLLAVFFFVAAHHLLGLAGPSDARLEWWAWFVGAWAIYAFFLCLGYLSAAWAVERAGERPYANGAAVGVLSAFLSWVVVNYSSPPWEFWELALLLAIGPPVGVLGGRRGWREHREEERLLAANAEINAAANPDSVARTVGAVGLRHARVLAVSLWKPLRAQVAETEGTAEDGAPRVVLRCDGVWAAHDGSPAASGVSDAVRRAINASTVSVLADLLAPPPAGSPLPMALVDPARLPALCWPVGTAAPDKVLALALPAPQGPAGIMLVVLGSGRLAPLGLRRLPRGTVRRFVALATHAATRLEALALMGEARSEGQEYQRRRTHHELHDSLAQELGVIVNFLEADEPDPGSLTFRALQIARHAKKEVRRLMFGLDNPALKDGLHPALRILADDLARGGTLRADFEVIGEEQSIPHGLEAAVFGVAREAANNVRKHAHGASRAKITLSYLEGLLVLDVRDDGPGYDPENAPSADADPTTSGGSGLRSWRRSVEDLGGTLSVEGGLGQGTTVTARLPTSARLVRPVEVEAG